MQLYIPVSRSEEGSQGRSELFFVRGVHRSAAKTLDGLRSEGYLQWQSQHCNPFGRHSCVRELSVPVAQEVTIVSSTAFRKRAPAPSGGVRK